MVCAGTMDITSDATTAAFLSPLHSAVSSPVSSVATARTTPKNTQTSLSDIRKDSPSAPSVLQMATAVTCMPG